MPMQQRSDLTPPLGGGMKGYFPFFFNIFTLSRLFKEMHSSNTDSSANNMKPSGNRVIA